jgi:ribose transport system substrate-binding protein
MDDDVNFTGILRDITETKNQEDKLKEAVKSAEKANLAKSEFLTRMSHELRTPMNAILGFAQLLSLDKKEVLADSQKDRVDEILTAGNHLLVLINEVLDLSCIESGEISFSLEKISLQEVLTGLVTIIRPTADQKGVQINSLKSQNTDLTVIADRTRLKQALLNLLSNAVKYNREGGGSYHRV